MANIWDELTTQLITDTTDREALNGIMSKYPAIVQRLDEGVLRQTDYGNRMNEVGRERDALKAKQDQLNTWYQENWDAEAKGGAGATKREVLLERQVDSLTEQIASGGDVDINNVWWDVEKKLKDAGYVNKTDIAGLAAKADLDAMSSQIPANLGFLHVRTVPLAGRMARELGRDITAEEFEGLVTHLVSDPTANMKDSAAIDAAYNRYMAGARAEKDLAAKKAELEEVTKALEAKKQEAITSAPQPSDAEAGTVPVSIRAAFQGTNGSGNKDSLEGVDLMRGSDVLAAAGVELWKQGKLGPAA